MATDMQNISYDKKTVEDQQSNLLGCFYSEPNFHLDVPLKKTALKT